MAKTYERMLARRMAVQALYKSEIMDWEIGQVASPETIIPDSGALPPYAVSLLLCVQEHITEIDELISGA